MAMRGFFIDNGAFEKYSHRISARRLITILRKASDSTMFPDNPAKGDGLFKPRTDAEAEYWKILRDDIKQSAKRYLASRENGRKGGRPTKATTDDSKKTNSPAPAPVQTAMPGMDRAAQIRALCGKLGRSMADKTHAQRVLVTEDFNLARLDGPIGEALRMRYPPDRSDVLHRISQWLRRPDKFLGEYVDAAWLNKQIQRFVQ